MATKRMLIDATHPEETRVVVVDGNRLDELEFESAARKQLKGNIYLAKVTRVEPSLQAAFVEYGGNRHGFLAFSEIHPDYYQIPPSDREEFTADQTDESEEQANKSEVSVEESGSDDSDQVEHNRPHYRNQRRYKIQEVIKKRQILLIQVVKEERGNKGAALTTFLSLAGRYCVLMPNTDKGGGISRKIASPGDRKRLKSVLGELNIPEGTAVIVRTAGSERSKSEIKRDFEYLMRLWSNIRDLTLQSQSPSMIYEEANLIKRSIRDMYSRDIDEVLVEGEEGYRTAKDFMKMLIPSHAVKVQPYREESKIPLFHRYQVEGQLDAMHSAIVQLPSGGYIVINPTEALVAIDVNSGRSTKERNIEETALKTNIEAADEIARSLRLRDLAGLIVVDFIDMEVTRNQIAVERRVKEAMKNDRARIQIGRISPFGLLEMSRQRLRPSFTETSTETCHYCHGTGVRRSLESTVLHVLRVIEEEGIRRRSNEIIIHVPTQVALYILNQKRDQLAGMEERYQMKVQLSGDDSLVSPEYKLDRVQTKDENEQTSIRHLGPEDSTKIEEIQEEVVEEVVEVIVEDVVEEELEQDDDGRKRKRRRRPRRRKSEFATPEVNEDSAEITEPAEATEEISSEEKADLDDEDENDDDKPRKRRRRGKRGGRRRTRRDMEDDLENDGESADETIEDDPVIESQDAGVEDGLTGFETQDTPQQVITRGESRRKTVPEEINDLDVSKTADSVEGSDDPSDAVEKTTRPLRRRGPRRKAAGDSAGTDRSVESDSATGKEKKPKRRMPRRTAGADVKEEKVAPVEQHVPTPVEQVAPAQLDAIVKPTLEAKVIATTAVVVKSSDGELTEVDSDKPKRKGWWSR
jgi:ribonuclease E